MSYGSPPTVSTLPVRRRPAQADVCMVLEGTYPYVAGGVSSWTHDLITAQSHLKFHLLVLLPPGADLTHRYQLPDNVSGLTRVYIQSPPRGSLTGVDAHKAIEDLRRPLLGLQGGGGLEEIRQIFQALAAVRESIGRRTLLNSKGAWNLLVEMYENHRPESSFNDYFWTWRSSLSGLYSVLLCDLPQARVYHTVSTGYAGLLAARAHIETGRPVLLTEHGIYTNERRIEIAMADWLYEMPQEGFDIDGVRRDLKQLWVEIFTSYSRACYQAAARIITLYEGNQVLQKADGADPEKMQVIPNGIDFERYSACRRGPDHPPTVALIGRVVPIKDVKTFIRACGLLVKQVPDLRAYVFGPTEEEENYYHECLSMVEYLGLEQTLEFTGKVKLDQYLGGVDVLALTSISEAQPLVILEVGAAGIPSVATDVGACRELILGDSREDPQLGPAGAVTPLSNPSATAQAMARLLQDEGFYQRCSEAARERVRLYYSKNDLQATYKRLYQQHVEESGADASAPPPEEEWMLAGEAV